jgi:N-methylhydantoinase B
VREWDAGDFSSIHSAEIVEEEHPCLVEECTLVPDSGGPGQWRGGLGLRRVVRILGPEGSLSVLSDRNVIPPYGVNGGLPGHPNAFIVERDGHAIATSAIPGKVSGFPLCTGDRVISCSAGGGGYGNPADRARQAIERDVRAGYVTPKAALEVYGVDGSNDLQARVNGFARPIVGKGLVRKANTRRDIEHISISSATARTLALAPHSLVELPGSKGAPLRGVVCIDDDLPAGAVAISSLAAIILEHEDGAPLVIRPLPTVGEIAS